MPVGTLTVVLCRMLAMVKGSMVFDLIQQGTGVHRWLDTNRLIT